MNIGIFTDCYLPTKNGVSTSIAQLKEGLEQRGHKVIIVTVNAPAYIEKDTTIYRLPSIPFNFAIELRFGLVNQRLVHRIVQQEQLQIIHTHTEFSLGWAGKRAAEKLKLPLIHTTHTMYEEYRHYLFWGKLLSAKMIQRILKLFLSHHDALVCPSSKAQNYFASFMPSLKTVVIGNGVCRTRFNPTLLSKTEKEQIRQTLGLASSDKIILYVGRMAKEKRVLELLEILVPFLKQQPNYKAMFVGYGPAYQQMIHAAAQNNLGQQLIFMGYVNWEQIPKLYAIANVFVTASLSEVHPMTVLEATCCGLPIVARRDDSYVGLVEEDYNGYLVDLDQQIIARLAEMMGNETKLLTYSQNSHRLANKFNIATQVEKLELLYQQLNKKTPFEY